MTIDLHTDYLGLRLRSPIVASAGPYTGDLDRLRELDAAGVAAVVLPSLFEEQVEHDTFEIDRLFSMHHDSFGEASSFFPEVDGYNTGVDAYLTHVAAARDVVDVPVIASLNGTNIGGWLKYARLLQDAGADAIELNLYGIAADPAQTGQAIEDEQLELVALIREEISIPLAVKISPYYSSLANFLSGLQEAGADGVVMFNRFYAPDLDLETLDIAPTISLSNTSEARLPLRWIGIAHEFLQISIAGSTGVHSGREVAKFVLAGADVAMMTSALLVQGPTHVAQAEYELREWMSEHDYTSVDQMRGAVSRDATADPAVYERANYIGNLTSYSSAFMASQSIRLQDH